MIVVHTALYWCEVWFLREKHIEIIGKFTANADQRIGRLNRMTASVCSFFGLGWIRLSTLVHIKKLLFLRTIIVMDDNALIRKVLSDRVGDFNKDPRQNFVGNFDSPLYPGGRGGTLVFRGVHTLVIKI